MQQTSTIKLVVSYLTRFLGVFLVAFSVMAAIQGFVSVININKDGSTGIRYVNETEKFDYLIVSTVSEYYPSYNSGIQPGDTLIKIDGRPVSDIKTIRSDLARKEIGEKVTYTVRRGPEIKDYELTLAPMFPMEKVLVFLFRTVPVFLLMAYLVVGLWGVLKSPYTTETILIALFCFCFGCFMYATVNVGDVPDTFIKKYLYFDTLREFVTYIMWLGPSFWVMLFATFPMKNRIYESNKFISLLFIFLLPIIVVISSLMNIDSSVLSILIFVMLFLQMGTGVVLLSKNLRKVNTALEKRQVRLMLFGVKYGSLSIGFGWLLIIFTQFILTGYIGPNLLLVSLFVFLLCEIGGLIIPFTFLNSFFQNKLLETESALKRRVRVFGVTIGLLGVYLFAIFVIVRLSVSLFEVRDPSVIIVSVLLLSLTFTPINKRILNWIDETFYPEKTKYAESLKSFINRIAGRIESGDLFNELTEWVQKTLGINSVVSFAVSGNSTARIPFRPNDPDSVVHRIRNGNKFFWDEISERSRITVDENEIEWVRENDIAVTIPMISQGELVGVLNLGKKQNEEDFSAEDLDILHQASTQTALALQNLNLQSVYIDKKRMDKELEMARVIQRRLMPQEIPYVHGLDIYGESRPCYEVAGDYYDIINNDEGNTFMVIADVSGKGAGAAMIMANLQASIRVGLEITEDFEVFISRINNHVYKNTSSSEFITFFIGAWVAGSNNFHYINAGHNPPVMIDKDGNVSTLDATGLILGVLPDQKYERKVIKVEEGSVIAIYTDGLEEAMNPKEEIFGQKRIIQCLMELRHHSAKEIVKKIQDSAIEFCEGKPLHDDLTMIVIKR
ncbi:MAG: SpoIIE family protein phosphatase [Ignavibacteria bacterium]|nr:SpoIIE family protein phosphatase [Ignavibacteria bacterium]